MKKGQRRKNFEIRCDIKPENRLAQENQVNLVDHENIKNKGSLPCKPSKPNT